MYLCISYVFDTNTVHCLFVLQWGTLTFVWNSGKSHDAPSRHDPRSEKNGWVRVQANDVDVNVYVDCCEFDWFRNSTRGQVGLMMLAVLCAVFFRVITNIITESVCHTLWQVGKKELLSLSWSFGVLFTHCGCCCSFFVSSPPTIEMKNQRQGQWMDMMGEYEIRSKDVSI